ncbi:hypothetical protein [Knoellia sinensis]|nr:hypothetical protein [Knoellia sinensis]
MLWPYLLILAGASLIIGALIYRRRIIARAAEEDYDGGYGEAAYQQREDPWDVERPREPEPTQEPTPERWAVEPARMPEPQPERSPEPERAPEPTPTPWAELRRDDTLAGEARSFAAPPPPEPVRPVAAAQPEAPVDIPVEPAPVSRPAEPIRAEPTPVEPAPVEPAPVAPPVAPRTEPRLDDPTPTITIVLPATPARVPAPAAKPDPNSSDPYAGLPDSHVLTEPPMIRWGETEVLLHDWMRYYSDGNVWSGVLTSFTESVAADPFVASYFTSSGDGTLARHSLSALIMLTSDGVTVGALRQMKAAHAGLVNEHGDPINAFVWNRLVQALSNALTEHGVRDATLVKLGATLEPLRAAIVAPVKH